MTSPAAQALRRGVVMAAPAGGPWQGKTRHTKPAEDDRSPSRTTETKTRPSISGLRSQPDANQELPTPKWGAAARTKGVGTLGLGPNEARSKQRNGGTGGRGSSYQSPTKWDQAEEAKSRREREDRRPRDGSGPHHAAREGERWTKRGVKGCRGRMKLEEDWIGPGGEAHGGNDGLVARDTS